MDIQQKGILLKEECMFVFYFMFLQYRELSSPKLQWKTTKNMVPLYFRCQFPSVLLKDLVFLKK